MRHCLQHVMSEKEVRELTWLLAKLTRCLTLGARPVLPGCLAAGLAVLPRLLALRGSVLPRLLAKLPRLLPLRGSVLSRLLWALPRSRIVNTKKVSISNASSWLPIIESGLAGAS